jgi:16S rRNA (guanine1207-N2)-methyltransferase
MKLGRHEHYFTHLPRSPKKDYGFNADIYGINLRFVTASGMFSPQKVDLGSLTLMTYMDIRNNTEVLDLGCGYGAIGLYAAKIYPSCKITMVEINERAAWAAKKNVLLNGVKNATAMQSFMFSALKNRMFDTILLNPPISAGLEVCYEMIEKSFDHLKEGGTMQVVAKNRKGGERISEKMKEVFGNLDVLGRKGGFWVYVSAKKL